MSVNYYDGSNLVEIPGTSSAPEKIGFGYATCSTAEATAAKEATLSDYVLKKNGYVSVEFTYNVPAASTLNINNKGAKAIYRYGQPIKANCICAGDLATFIYDGTNYNLIGLDSCGKGPVINLGTVSSLPVTYPTTGTDSRIKADMILDYFELGKPSAQRSTWNVVTSNGTVTINGSISGQTTLKISLKRGEEVT